MPPIDRSLLWLLAGWSLVLISALAGQPLWPIDETRYAGVAWEMWQQGHWLVPHLNGLPYSHKPPLLFWWINAGWALLGVEENWLRIAPALASLGALLLTRRLARLLWPDQPGVARLAPWLVLSSLLWTVFTPALMFDLLLTALVLLALVGVAGAARGSRWGWWLTGLALGLGILAKGPVALLHGLPAALLAPLWAPRPQGGWGVWYRGLGLAVAGGAALGLAWALPAALTGGGDYARAILWGQTAERMVQSFAHRRPLWWYLPLLPVLLFPWSLWPPLWRALAGLRRRDDPGVGFCLAWLLPVFVAFCLISGKQAHYLLPLFPALALLGARALTKAPPPGRTAAWPPLLVLIGLGLALLAAPWLGPALGAPAWTGAIAPWTGPMVLLGSTLALLAPRQDEPDRHSLGLGAAGIILVVAVNLGVAPPAAEDYDLTPAARLLAGQQTAGGAVAHVGDYQDQFHFQGRLRRPLEVIEPEQLPHWTASHPDALVVTYTRHPPPPGSHHPLWVQPFRDRLLTIWRAADLGAGGGDLADLATP